MLKAITKFFKKKEVPQKAAEIPQEELNVISTFAQGNMGLKESAIRIYLKYPHRKDLIEIAFMSEICNPCPDLALRGHYRKELIERLRK